ncbi:MAG: hypothetical protein AAB368_17140, partial [bacterium]
MDLATRRYLAGDHLAAADLLENALAKDSAREDARDLLVEVLMEYGSSLRLAGQYAEALATFKRARKAMPANARLMDLISATERAMQAEAAGAPPPPMVVPSPPAEPGPPEPGAAPEKPDGGAPRGPTPGGGAPSMPGI